MSRESAYQEQPQSKIIIAVPTIKESMGVLGALLPAICLIIMFVSYALWKKRGTIKTA